MKVLIGGDEYIKAPGAPEDKSLISALEQRFDCTAGKNISVRDYLRMLLEALWNEGEGFSSKRPFGKSGWDFELYKPLIAGGFIPGALDEDGRICKVDERIAANYVRALILAAFNGVA